MFCLEEIRECRKRSSNATLKQDLMHTTSDASRPLLKYVLSHGFGHLAHLGSGNGGVFKAMEILQAVISRFAWEWDQLCKLAQSVRPGIPWPDSDHDFMMYTLISFAPNALFRTFLDQSALAPREETNPLLYAVHFGKTDRARFLISRGANVNQRGLPVDKLAMVDSDMDDMDVDGSDSDNFDADTPQADSDDERKAMPVEVAVDHWNTEMVDLLLEQGSSIPDRLLTRVLKMHPHRFPLYIIHRLIRTAEFVKWAAPWDNRRLLEAFVEDDEDCEQTMDGDGLILTMKRLVQVGFGEMLLIVAVEKGCIPVVRTLLSISASMVSDVSVLSQTCGASSIGSYKINN